MKFFHGNTAKPLASIALCLAVALMFIGNSKRFVFHAPSCKYASCKYCNVSFKTFTEAVLAGYSPCGFCRLDMDITLRRR